MNDEKRKAVARERLTAYIAAKGLRNTPERNAILEVALELGAARNATFDIAGLHSRVDDKGLHLSRATIYNTVSLLTSAGILSRYSTPGGATEWRLNAAESGAVSIMLVCSECGRQRRVRDTSLSQMLQARHFASFTTGSIDVCVNGICSGCRSGRNKR